MRDSPEYHCQFVFVTNDRGVPRPGRLDAGDPGDNGSSPCRRSSPYSRSTTSEKASRDSA